MSETYPERPAYFAHRFVRLLTKTAAANEIGSDACWMLTVVAMQEDSKWYTGPVTYYNEQLMPLCAFGGRTRLVTAREKAIAAGWLHYEQGGKGVAGRYWVTIPPQYAELPDGPCDESDEICRPESGRQNNLSSQNRTATGTTNGRQPDGKASSFIPSPNPDPKNAQSRKSGSDVNGFEQWYLTYPRKVSRDRAVKPFQKKLAELTERHDGDHQRALEWLIDRTKQFADSPAGKAREFTPHPATWLNDGRFDDDPAEWSRGSNRGKQPPARIQSGEYDV